MYPSPHGHCTLCAQTAQRLPCAGPASPDASCARAGGIVVYSSVLRSLASLSSAGLSQSGPSTCGPTSQLPFIAMPPCGHACWWRGPAATPARPALEAPRLHHHLVGRTISAIGALITLGSSHILYLAVRQRTHASPLIYLSLFFHRQERAIESYFRNNAHWRMSEAEFSTIFNHLTFDSTKEKTVRHTDTGRRTADNLEQPTCATAHSAEMLTINPHTFSLLFFPVVFPCPPEQAQVIARTNPRVSCSEVAAAMGACSHDSTKARDAHAARCSRGRLLNLLPVPPVPRYAV